MSVEKMSGEAGAVLRLSCSLTLVDDGLHLRIRELRDTERCRVKTQGAKRRVELVGGRKGHALLEVLDSIAED